VYDKMGEYSKALSYYEKALEIRQKTLPANHPSLATSYNNIGLVYDNMGEYSKALSYYERALGIFQRSLPPNHPHIKTVRENIEFIKKKLWMIFFCFFENKDVEIEIFFSAKETRARVQRKLSVLSVTPMGLCPLTRSTTHVSKYYIQTCIVTEPPQHNFGRSLTRRRVSLCRIKERAIRQAEENKEEEKEVSLLLQWIIVSVPI
jgi:tetratricopeptide (TPR) repeat protein